MARGEHRPRRLEVPGGEIGLVGRAQSEGDHIRATGAHTVGEGRSEAGRRIAHVVADHHILSGRADLVDEGGADRLDHLDGQRHPDEAAHIIGLDGGVEVGVDLFGRERGVHLP